MSRNKYLNSAPKSVTGGDSSRSFALSGGGSVAPASSDWFAADDAYHVAKALPSDWKLVTVEAQGRVLTETNDAQARVSLLGSYASLKDVFLYGGFWGFGHNAYQYAEKNWFESNMLYGQAVGCSYSLTGHQFGSITNYYWKFILTAFPKKNYVVFHSEVNGNRRTASSSYQVRYITQAAFSLTPSVLNQIDVGFHGQAIDMAGEMKVTK